MTTSARTLASLLGLAAAACAFLPWLLGINAWHLHVRTLLSPGKNEGVGVVTSVGLAVVVAGAVIVLGAILSSRMLVIVGGLLSVAVPSIWILSNAISTSDGGTPLAQIQVGAYGTVGAGLLTLILAAVARDTARPTAR
jgi:hypothetical protein